MPRLPWPLTCFSGSPPAGPARPEPGAVTVNLNRDFRVRVTVTVVVVTVTRQSGRRSAGSVEPGPGCPGRALRLHRDALPGARLPHLGGRRRGRAPGRLRHWQAPGTRVPSRGTGPEHRKLSSGVSTRPDCERRIPGPPRRLGFRHGDSDSESIALATCRITMSLSGVASQSGRGFEFDPGGVASSASDRPGRDSDRPRSAAVSGCLGPTPAQAAAGAHTCHPPIDVRFCPSR